MIEFSRTSRGARAARFLCIGFAGALAVALAEGRSLEDSLRFANAAGGLVVTKRGAQDAMPDRAEVERLLDSAWKGATL